MITVFRKNWCKWSIIAAVIVLAVVVGLIRPYLGHKSEKMKLAIGHIKQGQNRHYKIE